MVWMIYLIGGIDGFLGMLCGVSIASMLAACFLAVSILCEDMDRDKWPIAWRFIAFSVVSLMSFVITPNSKTIAAMYLLPKIAANEHVKRIPDKALNVLEKKLDAYLESFDEKKKK